MRRSRQPRLHGCPTRRHSLLVRWNKGEGGLSGPNSALEARVGRVERGEWAEALCGKGGVARLMPALQQMHARMMGSTHVEKMEAALEACQACPRSPRPHKLD